MKKNKEAEIWLPIRGYEGKYKISSYGRVMSYRAGKWKEIKGHILPNGYVQVGLRKDGKVKWFLVHRLVAEHFSVNMLYGTEIDHIDGNKKNNRLDNLRWCTSSENKLYVDKDIRRKKIGSLKKIVQADLYGNVIQVWRSALAAEKWSLENGKRWCSECILGCCKGIGKTAYGYLWWYENDKKEQTESK